jgi:hypothetical protein
MAQVQRRLVVAATASVRRHIATRGYSPGNTAFCHTCSVPPRETNPTFCGRSVAGQVAQRALSTGRIDDNFSGGDDQQNFSYQNRMRRKGMDGTKRSSGFVKQHHKRMTPRPFKKRDNFNSKPSLRLLRCVGFEVLS